MVYMIRPMSLRSEFTPDLWLSGFVMMYDIFEVLGSNPARFMRINVIALMRLLLQYDASRRDNI